MAGSLQPLPSPGVAIFLDLIAKQPTSLVMKGEHLGSSYDITTTDGQPVFRIESKHFSMSQRKDVINSRSGQKLCSIRKKNWTIGWKYYAETQEDGPHLFDFETHTSFTEMKCQMNFANAAENGRPMQIDVKSKVFGGESLVRIGGVPVAVIERKWFKLRTELHLHITSGLDMFLIVAVAVALEDKKTKQKTKKRRISWQQVLEQNKKEDEK